MKPNRGSVIFYATPIFYYSTKVATWYFWEIIVHIVISHLIYEAYMWRRYVEKNMKYYPGQKLGQYNTLFIERLDGQRGKFQCHFCGETFEARITNVATGRCNSCGCLQKKSVSGLRYKDLSNQRFGNLLVKNDSGKRSKDGRVIWECLCSCGRRCLVSSHELLNGDTISCGCYQKEQLSQRRFKDLTGQRFGKLTVLSLEKRDNINNRTYWKCKCDCGREKIATSADLIQEHSKSCGCLKSKGESKIKDILENSNIKFELQKYFSGCLSDKQAPLYFDFYLPDYNCCIEYDGEQHFECRNSGWNNQEAFIRTIQRDEQKNNYCKKYGINLIRIPYWDYNILDEKYIINKLSLKKEVIL